MTTLGIVVVVGAIFVLLGISGVLSFRRKIPRVDISAALRELLVAQAEGKISAEEFERRQAELHASLMDSPPRSVPALRHYLRWAIPALVAVIAVPAVVWYAVSDKPKEAEAPYLPAPSASSGPRLQELKPPPQANSGGDLNVAAKRLEEKMAKDPNNGEGWLLLARTYGEFHQYKEAVNAYAKAAALLPPNAAMLAEWADANVLANERKWDDASREIVKRALSADPKHLKTLALAGSEAFERADYKQAVSYWKRMQAAAPSGSMDAKLAEMNIQEANAMLAKKKPG